MLYLEAYEFFQNLDSFPLIRYWSAPHTYFFDLQLQARKMDLVCHKIILGIFPVILLKSKHHQGKHQNKIQRK